MKPLLARARRAVSMTSITLAVGLATLHAGAAPFVDAAGDYLASYAGPRDADLDVRFADVVIDPQAGSVTLFGTLAGPIDRASTKFYVFGIDRGRGDVGRDLVFQGPLGGTPPIGADVRWDAAVGLTATGQAVFFDALHPGIVPLPDVAVRIAGAEISATVPLALFPSQGFEPKDYTFNLWPRSQVSLANTTVSDFAPDNGDARVGIVGRRTRFDLIRAAGAEAAGCLPDARAEARVASLGEVETMDLSVRGLPPRSHFNVFVTQLPNAPFGVSWYAGEVETNAHGEGHQRLVGRFSAETFAVAPGSGPAPGVHHEAIVDAQSNPPFGPLHSYHVGLWFESPADAVKAGCPGNVTPFGGTHAAGVQALSTRNFDAASGPLRNVRP